MKTPLLTSALCLLPAVGFAQDAEVLPDGRQITPAAFEAPLRTTKVQSEAKFAILSTKIVTCAEVGPMVVNNGVLLVNMGKIEAVGRQSEIEIPEGYEVIDAGDNWVIPGMIDLHSHVGGSLSTNDLNDTVFLTNPGLRAFAAVTPGNSNLRRALAGGVTSVLYIPGSGSNIGGQGVLMKTGFDTYENTEIRNPGSMKLAQAGNPERFAFGVARSFMNWHTRETLKRGITYAQLWEDFAAGTGEQPEIDIQWELFRDLLAKRTQVSAHTQIYQVVLESLTMVTQEFGLDLYIDHGTIGAWRLGGLAQELGVPAMLGPRNVDAPARGFMQWAGHIEAEGFRGVAAGYQQAGHKVIGFNTDSPVIMDEEYTMQAAMAVHFGLDDSDMTAVRGLTINPAIAAGIDDIVGSLEVGKHADIVVLSGHPADPRSRISKVFIEGRYIQ